MDIGNESKRVSRGGVVERCDVPPGRWVHRIAVLAVCLVWPLIWVGGLVTTYDAGMAVPDWPGTYGYNLFLYPYETWLLGPFDLFIEHGHRLLGAVVGMVAIALVVVAWLSEPRRWVRWLSVGVLVAVIAQGVLGGARVLLTDRALAMIHGCTGPAFFALCVITAAVTSRWWWALGGAEGRAGGGLTLTRSGGTTRRAVTGPGWGAVWLAASLSLACYVQLVFGAQLRHVQPAASPGSFAHTLALHLLTAVIVWLLAAGTAVAVRRCGDLSLSRPALILIGLVTFQVALGVGTWVVKYGFPQILGWFPGAVGYVVRSKGWGSSLLITSHVATGSFILAVSCLVLIRLLRYRHGLASVASGDAADQASFVSRLRPETADVH